MFRRNHHVTTVVRSMYEANARTKVLELADPDDWDLPSFEPGAHIDVHVRERLVRQYSLCGSPRNRKRYEIAVQLEKNGRGGSEVIHKDIAVGSEMFVSLPRNHFPLVKDGNHHILIAGGIGVTPILPMIETLERDQRSFELHYCTPSAADVAFKRRLSDPAISKSVKFHHSRGAGNDRLDISKLVSQAKGGTHIYCCGPERMIESVLSATKDWPTEFVHVERFGTSVKSAHGDAAYKVKLARSGLLIDVLPGQSMLSAIREAGIEIDASCEAGVCLSCKTRCLEGSPIHRDLLMTPSDRREFLTPCVSGSSTGTLVLDL